MERSHAEDRMLRALPFIRGLSWIIGVGVISAVHGGLGGSGVLRMKRLSKTQAIRSGPTSRWSVRVQAYERQADSPLRQRWEGAP